MHLKENCNLEDFLNKVKECRSKVTFRTSEGDILAMQSTLCQLIFVSSNISRNSSIAARYAAKT